MAAGVADRWDAELIVPLVLKPEQVNHDSRELLVTARVKPGVSIRRARANMDAVTATLAQDYPKSNRGWGALVEPLKNDFFPADRQLTLWMLLAGVGFLLLIAYVNVANLLLAKGMARRREVGIRGSLGAKPATIFAQFLTESLATAILSGLLGIATGYVILRGFIAVMPAHMLPAEADLRLNVPVLIFSLAVATLAGVLFGCAPAWYAARVDPAEVLKEGGRLGTSTGQHWLRRVLVMAEFALAFSLLAGAGLTIQSFWKLTRVDLGINTDHILGLYVDPVRDPKQVDVYYRRILAGIKAVPGVSAACAMTYLPLEGLHFMMPFNIAGHPTYAESSKRPDADLQIVTPDYFQTFGIRVVKGRAFTEHDIATSFKVAMINVEFANRFLKGVDPVQQHLVMSQPVPGEPTQKLATGKVEHLVGICGG